MQPEPVRSRTLAMLVECQVQAGDAAGAAKTASTIRDYPGLEKRRALNALADWYEKSGDAGAAKTLLRQALQCMQAKAPENAQAHMDDVRPLQVIARHRFIDFEHELDPRWVDVDRQRNSLSLLSRLGETGEAVASGAGHAGRGGQRCPGKPGWGSRPSRGRGRGAEAGCKPRDA